MGASIPDDAAPTDRSRRKKLIFTGLGIIIGLFLINDIFGLINGGGFFSIISAMEAVQRREPDIDVDGAGLRILFVAFCSVTATLTAVLLNADMGKRATSAVFILSIIGGGFILDAVYGPGISKGYMTDHGYTRCRARDHLRGSGKSSVWFDNYVLIGANCPAARSEK